MISILMPVFNAEHYLKETLESIIAQTEENWELIAVNDHSTDASAMMLSKFSEQDDRIKVFNNPGKGIVDALTFAFLKSAGKLITRMDADDIMMKTKLKKLSKELKSNKGSIITSYVKYFSDKNLGDGYKNYERWLNKLIDRDDHYKNIYKECVIPSPNWMMDRSTLEKLGGFSELDYPEDYDLAFKAYHQKLQIVGIKEALHHWRDYPERTSRNHDHYKDNAFLDLKTSYFLKIDKDDALPLVLWGAGKKGKRIAKILHKQEVVFHWVTNNKKKVGLKINGVKLESEKALSKHKKAQLIIAVAGPEDQKEIKKALRGKKQIHQYWFC